MDGKPTDLEALTPLVYAVRKHKRETRDIVTLAIRPKHGVPPLAYLPGQFNMLYVHGVGEIPVSVSGTDEEGSLLHTVRDVGAVSKALCRLRPGAELGVRGPFGTAWPLHAISGRSLAFVAGGLGLAPLRAAIRNACARRDELAHLALWYGTRTPQDILFAREWRRWALTADVASGVTVDRAYEPWSGRVGVVTGLMPAKLPDLDSWTAFVCGPEVMMRHVAMDLVRRGVSKAQIFLSLERNMKCALGVCGHCQLGPMFVCRQGPVVSLAFAEALMAAKEL